MKNVSVSEAQTLKKPIFCNVRLEKMPIYIYIYIYKLAMSVCLCLTNYMSDGLNSDMGHTYEV